MPDNASTSARTHERGAGTNERANPADTGNTRANPDDIGNTRANQDE